jgi:glutamate racemase
MEDIQRFVRGITRFFLERDAKTIIIACNAASAASLYHARETFPETPFVGMEPAIKPAAERTRTGIIGVITTQATYQGQLFASVVDRFANGIQVVTQVCPEFVTLVERGQLDGGEVRRVAQGYLHPLLEAQIDHLVLGCTHFPFLTPALQEVVGSGVEIVDPGPAVARQTGRVIDAVRHFPDRVGRVTYYTSGDPDTFHSLASRLMPEAIERQQVFAAEWRGDTLHAAD